MQGQGTMASTASSSAWRQALVINLEATAVEVTHVKAASKLTTQAIGAQIEFSTFNNLTQQDESVEHGVQEQDLQDYNRKLKEFEAQQQTMQDLQAQLQKVQAQIQAGQAQIQAGLAGGIQGEPQVNVASAQRPEPHFDPSTSMAIDEAGLEAQLQRALFGEAAGLSLARPVVFGSSLSPPIIAEGADLPIAESTVLEPAPADEFGQDLASMVEVLSIRTEDFSIRTEESLDVSRASTVCMGLQGLGLDSEHNPPAHQASAKPKRRNSQVERRNSQGDSPAPAVRVRGLTN